MLLIARRYLLSTKSHSVVNIIAWVSLVSLLLPVAAVVVLLSIFNGLGSMVSSVESYVEGDLTLRLRDGRHFSIEEMEAQGLRSVDGVESLSYVSDQMALVSYGGNNSLVTLRGVDESYVDVVSIADRLYAGDFETSDADQPLIILGNTLAAHLGARSLGQSSVELMSLRGSKLQSAMGLSRESHASATLSGILTLDPEYEERYAYTSLESVNALIGRDGDATRLSIKVSPQESVESVRRDIEGVVGGDFRVERRSELNPTLHQIIRYEKFGVGLISSFVMLLASFSLIGALTMLIIEKSDDIATLRSMGMSRRSVEMTFFEEGALISCCAIVAGVVLGSAVTLAQQCWGFVELPSSTMAGLAYPVELRIADVASVVIMSLTITLSISWIVSRRMVKLRAR
ncbi:MAG: FtsX-like permease family protein [Rikenellaceae bacterium]